ncbi:uncharacterized protein LOC143232214 [Tachypleus tridentatus]|uniref:uncharacterized protein LOC143232214 n=1 Tax=Tachypleus tridentatus TaxID=6853 RepID=UPI003FD48477
MRTGLQLGLKFLHARKSSTKFNNDIQEIRESSITIKSRERNCKEPILLRNRFQLLTYVDEELLEGGKVNASKNDCGNEILSRSLELNVRLKSIEKEVEECRINNGNCDHICKTSPRGLECECRKGWRLDTDKRSCVDINECKVNDRCGAAKCFDTPGSYVCRCPEHEHMIAKEHTETGGNVQFSIRCMEKNWCDEVCDHYCDIGHSKYACACFPGYTLKNNACQKTCKIDNGGCQYTCSNTETGTLCSCPVNSTLKSDNQSCEYSGIEVSQLETLKILSCPPMESTNGYPVVAALLLNVDKFGTKGSSCLTYDVSYQGMKNLTVIVDAIARPFEITVIDKYSAVKNMVRRLRTVQHLDKKFMVRFLYETDANSGALEISNIRLFKENCTNK